MKRIFVFEASEKNEIYGYTTQEEGANLPTAIDGKSVSWQYIRTLEVEANEHPRIGINTSKLLNGINENGFFIDSTSITSKVEY